MTRAQAIKIGFGVLASAVLMSAGVAVSEPPSPGSPEKLRAVISSVADQAQAFAKASPPSKADRTTAYQFEFEGLSVPRIPMTAFRGEVVLVVNTASQCGFTPQYKGLEALQEKFHRQGFDVLGVPSNDFGEQEPGTSAEIRHFCEANYGVTFPMAAKSAVIGQKAHPFYRWAETQLGPSARPQWNFHKLLIGRDGRLIAAFPSAVEPDAETLAQAIASALRS